MPDVISVLFKWWKPMLVLMAVTTLLTWAVVSFLPKEYVSVATALPASSTAADKAGIFNTTILTLYPSIGTTDDLDKIEGTARLDTLFLAVAQKAGLPKAYGLPDDEYAVYNAAMALKKNTRIGKSEFGELKIRVWDKSNERAAQLANALLQQLQVMHQHLQSQSNNLILQNLQKDYVQLAGTTSTDSMAISAVKEQLQRYAQLINEYKLMVNTNPPVLLVVEPARPALYPDRPDVVMNVAIAFFVSAVFSFLLVVAMEGRSRTA